MIDLAPFFLRGSSPALVSEQAVQNGLKGWILGETYGVALGNSLGEVVLNGINANTFFPANLSDYCRFALAAKETIHLSFDDAFDKHATAWALIKRYYSSFFSAHALLRTHNKGVIWIDADEANHLEKIGKLYVGQNFNIKRGGYSFEFNPGNGFNAEIKLAPVSYGGGSHDDFWRYFLAHLSLLGEQILQNNVPMASQAVARLDELRRIVMAPTAKGVWLSFMRNEINYRHKFGTWYPFKPQIMGAVLDRRTLQQTNSTIDLTVDVSRYPLKAFNAATCCLALLNNDLAVLIKERTGLGSSQFRSSWDRLQNKLSA